VAAGHGSRLSLFSLVPHLISHFVNLGLIWTKFGIKCQTKMSACESSRQPSGAAILTIRIGARVCAQHHPQVQAFARPKWLRVVLRTHLRSQNENCCLRRSLPASSNAKPGQNRGKSGAKPSAHRICPGFGPVFPRTCTQGIPTRVRSTTPRPGKELPVLAPVLHKEPAQQLSSTAGSRPVQPASNACVHWPCTGIAPAWQRRWSVPGQRSSARGRVKERRPLEDLSCTL
jgi:hypothetical protein